MADRDIEHAAELAIAGGACNWSTRMDKLLCVFAASVFLCNSTHDKFVDDDYYELILSHNYRASSWFGESFGETGVENSDDPNANTYSIIGLFDDYQRELLLHWVPWKDLGFYRFKLVYTNVDASVDTLEWSQVSWLTDSSIRDADLYRVANDSNADCRFNGLGKSSMQSLDGSVGVFLDGDGDGNCSNSATVGVFSNRSTSDYIDIGRGRPAFSGNFAMVVKLYVLRPRGVVSVTGCDGWDIWSPASMYLKIVGTKASTRFVLGMCILVGGYKRI